MKYFQCCKDKKLKTTSDTPELSEIICCDRRMREFKARGTTTAQAQYDHEVLQRAWIDGGKIKGSEPTGTDLMAELKI